MRRSGDRPSGDRLWEVVLVGGGHAHVQVLRGLAIQPLPGARVTLVVDTPIAVYSGMVPGFVAGQYRAEQLEIDVMPLARRAGARVILARAVGVDAPARRLLVEGRPSLAYDLASFDVGSTVSGLDRPGIAEHALPTRPIGRFVAGIERAIQEVRRRDDEVVCRTVVVGGGAGRVEVAFTLRERLRHEGVEAELSLVHAGPRLLSGYPDGLVRRVRDHARARGIALLEGRTVEAAHPGEVVLDGGQRLASDLLVWVTGAVAQGLFAPSGLPTDGRGFVLVRPTLQVLGRDDLFAVGDCATLSEDPWTPKAGVYAVRQGPYLLDNLRRALAARRLRAYRPQRDFLTLLNLGDGSALGTRAGLAFQGAWVMRLKDWIDRRFMARFQVLDAGGEVAPAFAGEARVEGRPMLCGGCAAKVGSGALERALARLGPGGKDETVELGLEAAEDAAAVRLPGGDLVVSSVDAFRPFTDDPYLVARVAAVNAASDLFAKGVAPRYAQALVAVPQELAPQAAEELLVAVLRGLRESLEGMGASLVGGHTSTAPELLVGLGVEGVLAAGGQLLAQRGLAAGQELVLSKALGTGVVLHADMRALARGPWVEAAIASMLRTNAEASRVARRLGASAATDVSGFGLAGHAGSMARASGVTVELDLAALPALPGALPLLARGVHSTSQPENERARRDMAVSSSAVRDPRLALLFDPQTSGGLLFAVADGRGGEAVSRLREAGDRSAAAVGRVLPRRDDGAPVAVVAGGAPRGALLEV